MIATLPSSTPTTHARFLKAAVDRLARDARIAGVAAGGSLASDAMDEFSDLDLVIAAEPSVYDEVINQRREIAESLGPLLAAFTGEHVAEPRLLICLYAGEPPLHVDLKFISLADAATRVEDPLVLWERSGLLTRALSEGVARYPAPDRQWIEDRFWVWVHYAATKIARGEAFEAVGFLAYLRNAVLGPLALLRAGARPAGVRKLEQVAAKEAELLRPTVSGLSRAECISSVRAAVEAYRAFRADESSVVVRDAAEVAATRYLTQLDAQPSQFRHKVDVRQPAAFLRRVMRELVGGARLSLEGTFDEAAFPAEAIMGREPTATLRRNTLEPRLQFLLLELEPERVDRVFSQISRIGLREDIVHVQIEKDGILELAAYDNFHSECVVTGPAVSPELLAELQAAGVVRSFSPAGGSSGVAPVARRRRS